ncbi:hypothetical protein M407DRAFT_244430 [Tulasnella calospora MUT 4182]|uniref:C2H2-type domain-containing protein n=1 Tax=Tulasnella calospora MUT 4182 TaxID=1051891 RepID=A0A0C3LT02_9AGAM|nr:hypothetical protein M407DRAFT_244430 [Tulasnella calospora MUT 4182]
MSSCHQCGKTLANPIGLRRHINTQHEQSKYHECECGKQFLDPAGRSRCRARHSRSFGCPVRGCGYRSTRKDSAKQHMRRRHPDQAEQEVVTLPPRMGSSSGSLSDDRFGFDPSPSPDPLPVTPYILQPQLYLNGLWPSQPNFYYSETSSQAWPAYENPN